MTRLDVKASFTGVGVIEVTAVINGVQFRPSDRIVELMTQKLQEQSKHTSGLSYIIDYYQMDGKTPTKIGSSAGINSKIRWQMQ